MRLESSFVHRGGRRIAILTASGSKPAVTLRVGTNVEATGRSSTLLNGPTFVEPTESNAWAGGACSAGCCGGRLAGSFLGGDFFLPRKRRPNRPSGTSTEKPQDGHLVCRPAMRSDACNRLPHWQAKRIV